MSLFSSAKKQIAALACGALLASLLPAVPAFAATTTDSLLGYWKLDETSGTNAADSSGDGKTGTLTNGPVISATPVAPTTFANTRSLQFDGTDDYVSTSLAFPSSGTISTWAYPTSLPDWISPAGWKLLGATNGYALIDVGNANHWRAVFRPNNSGNAEANVSASSTIATNAWTHIVMTWKLVSTTYTVALYVNGTLQGTTTWTGTPGAGGMGGFNMGKSGDFPDNYFLGNVDDVRVYNRALSRSEISDLSAGSHPRVFWQGTNSTSFENATNWSGSYIPDPYSRLVIQPTVNRLTLTGSLQIAGMQTNTGSIAFLNGQSVTINDGGAVTNYGTLGLMNTESLTAFSIPTDKGTVMLVGTGSQTGLVAGNTYKNLILNDGLITYLKFDEKSGTRAADASGYGFSGSLVNGAAISASTPPTNFHNPRSISFDGNDDHIQLPSGYAAFPRGITIALWAKPVANANWGRFLDLGNGTSSNNILFARRGTTSDLQFEVYNGSTGGGAVATGALINNEWHEYIVTESSNGSVLLYRDGRLVGRGATNTPNAIMRTLNYIGRSNWGADSYYQGGIDDVRIYNRVLNQNEISALGAGNEPATASGTVTLNGALTVNGNLILNGRQLDVSASNYAVNLGGSWLNNGGTFNARKGTVTFAAATSGLEILSGGQWFNTVVMNGGIWNARDRLTASGALNLASGILNASGSYAIHAGSWLQSGGQFVARSGLVVLISSANSTLTPFSAFNGLHIEDPTESGLVSYWKFDEGNGVVIRDSSGYGNVAVRSGTGAAWSGSSLASNIQFDNAFAQQFNGSSDKVEVPQSSLYELQAFTISAWIDLSANAGDRNAILTYGQGTELGGSSATESVGFIYHKNANLLRLRLNNGAGASFIDLQPNPGPFAGRWAHVAATWNGTTATVYLDGAPIGAATNPDTIGYTSNPFSKLRIGNWFGNNERFFNGGIDDVRIYNRALSRNELVNLARGHYANGAASTSIFGLGGNLIAGSLVIDSGNFNGTAYSTETTNPLILSRGDGTYTGGIGYSRFTGLTVSGSSFVNTAGTTDINGNLSIFTGSLVASNSTTVSGNWSKTGGTFDPNSGTVVFDGTNQAFAGTTTFANFTKAVSTADTLTLASGSLLSVANGLVLHGDAGGLLTLRSAAPGNPWSIDPQGTRTVNYLDVQDSKNINGTILSCMTDTDHCVDSGNNTNWMFTVPTSSSSSQPAAVGGNGGYHGQQTALKAALEARAKILSRYSSLIGGASSSHPGTPVVATASGQTSSVPTIAGGSSKFSDNHGHLVAQIGNQKILYRDVKTDSWYAPYVASLIEDNIAQGYKNAAGKPTGVFGVASPIKRSEILKMALEATGTASGAGLQKLPPPRNASARGTWAANYVRIAEDLHFTIFTPDVDVNQPATRGEVVQIILEALKIPIGNAVPTYTDVSKNYLYAPAIAVATFYGLVEGDTDANGQLLNLFRPNDDITRGEAAKIVSLAKELVKN